MYLHWLQRFCTASWKPGNRTLNGTMAAVPCWYADVREECNHGAWWKCENPNPLSFTQDSTSIRGTRTPDSEVSGGLSSVYRTAGGCRATPPSARLDGFFCVRFVFSPRSELTVKGGWAGVKVTPASEVPERARLASVASRRVRWESAPPVG